MATNNIKDFRFSIYINNEAARKSLIEMEQLSDKYAATLSKLAAAGKTNSTEYNRTREKLDQVKASMQEMTRQAGLSSLSLSQLTSLKKALNYEFSKAVPGSDKWNKLKSDIQAVNTRMSQLRIQNNQTELSLKKISEGVNKYIGLITVFLASFTGIILGIRKNIDAFARWDDKLADVMKTTNMTKEEVKGLNSELMKVDTRTTQESLLDLARDAGKLGIEGSRNIRDFVEAGDQINVALGEDLGEDAIKNIGKMVGVFKSSTKELQNLDLKEQMLSVGSAINELGANSTASEPYLVNFAGRLGGIAKQANISMDAILGYGSALDQDMQQVEMSATAFQNFIMKLMGDPAKFARLAGLEVNKFTTLLKTDANAAIKQVLTSLNQQGGFQALIPIFEEMGLDGTRATGVLSAMAGSIDKIEQAQSLANQAMREGISVTREFETKNNTAQAQLEKARKGFTEMSVELGEKLSPLMTLSTNGLTYFLRTLKTTIEFVAEHRTVLITLTAALVGYTVAAKAATLMEQIRNKESKAGIALAKAKIILNNAALVGEQLWAAATMLLTGNIKGMTQALRAANSVMKLSPWGMAGAAVTALIGLMIALKNSVNEVSLAQRSLNDVHKQTQQNMATEKLQLDMLLSVARDETRSKDERLAAIKRLNELSPQYLGNLNLETINTQKGKEAIDQYIASLEKKAKAEALYNKLKEIEEKKIEVENTPTETTTWQDIKSAVASAGNQMMGQSMQAKYIAQNKQQQLAELEKAKQAIKKEMQSVDMLTLDSVLPGTTNETNEANKTNETNTTNYSNSNDDTKATGKQFGVTGKGKKKHFSQEKFREDYQVWLDKTIDEEISNADKDAKKKLQDMGIDMSEAFDDVKGDVSKTMNKSGKEINKDIFDKTKGYMESQHEQKKAKINADPTLQEDDRNKQLYDAEKSHLEAMKTLYEAYGQDIDGIDRKMAEAKTEYNEAIRKAAQERSQAEIKAGYETGQSAIESAQTVEEATQNVLNSIRSSIKAKLSEGLAIQLVNVLKAVPFPFNLAAAAAASAAFSLLFDKVVPQFEEGRYPVIGEKDGKTYYPDYQDTPRTGLYTRPTLIKGLGLVAENRSEIVISNPHVRHLQMNYPDVIRTIYRTASRVPQFDDGNYPKQNQSATQSPKNTEKEDLMIALLQRIAASNEKPFRGYITYNDLNDTFNEVDGIEKGLK